MEFLIGVFVGGLMVGGIMFAKIMAYRAEANAGSNDYLTGKGRAVVPTEPVYEDGPVTGGHGEGL